MEKISQQKAVNILKILYPFWMVFGMFGIMYVPSKLIVTNNAAETAKNILSNEFLFRVGIVSSLITQLIFIFAVVFLYILFKQVIKNQALLMVILGLVSVPIAMLNELNNLAALLSLHNPEQMMFFLTLHSQGIIIASLFWGLWLFPLGILIYRSGYFPKIVGFAVIIAGIGYTTSSFLKLLVPNFVILTPLLDFMTFGEVVFLGWLVFKGAKFSKMIVS